MIQSKYKHHIFNVADKMTINNKLERCMKHGDTSFIVREILMHVILKCFYIQQGFKQKQYRKDH